MVGGFGYAGPGAGFGAGSYMSAIAGRPDLAGLGLAMGDHAIGPGLGFGGTAAGSQASPGQQAGFGLGLSGPGDAGGTPTAGLGLPGMGSNAAFGQGFNAAGMHSPPMGFGSLGNMALRGGGSSGVGAQPTGRFGEPVGSPQRVGTIRHAVNRSAKSDRAKQFPDNNLFAGFAAVPTHPNNSMIGKNNIGAEFMGSQDAAAPVPGPGVTSGPTAGLSSPPAGMDAPMFGFSDPPSTSHTSAPNVAQTPASSGSGTADATALVDAVLGAHDKARNWARGENSRVGHQLNRVGGSGGGRGRTRDVATRGGHFGR